MTEERWVVGENSAGGKREEVDREGEGIFYSISSFYNGC